jgi:hypothetical protein
VGQPKNRNPTNRRADLRVTPETAIHARLKNARLDYAPQEIASLFDHLVGERQQIVRQFDPERLGGDEVDHELELGRLHDR